MENTWDIMTDAVNGYWTDNLGRMLHFRILVPALNPLIDDKYSTNSKVPSLPSGAN